MERYILITLTAGFLLLTCSENPSEPTGGQVIPVDTTTAVNYELDNARATQAIVDATAGGTVAAVAQDSVRFELDIPPYALASNTTITITPFSMLTIRGPGGSSCSGCGLNDSLCCFHGAWFEPDGLVLDSPVTLTIQFPEAAYPFDCGGVIACIDSSGDKYDLCLTYIDTAAHTLTAEITHFSGYATDDERYDRLEAEIGEAADELAAQIGNYAFYNSLNPLKILHFSCSGHGDPGNPGYPDLVQLIETIVLNAYTQHANIIRQGAINSRTCEALYELDLCHRNIQFPAGEWSNATDFAALAASLLSDLKVETQTVAEHGKYLCESDTCDAGRAKLECAFEFALDPLDDNAMATQIGQWLDECCEITVRLNADKLVIPTCILAEEDADDAVINFTVTVSASGNPVEDCTVNMKWDRNGTSRPCANEGDGVYTCVWPAVSIPTSHCPPHGIAQNFWADVRYQGEQHLSDFITVMFAGVKISTSINYVYYYNFLQNTTFFECEASVNGNGTGCWGYNTCDGELTRAYMRASNTGNTIAVDQLMIPACVVTPFYVTVPVSGTEFSIDLLTAVEVDVCRTFDDIIFQSCPSDDTCSTGEGSMPTGSAWFQLALPIQCEPFEQHLLFENDGAGGFEAFAWDTLITGEYSLRSATLEVDVSVGF